MDDFRTQLAAAADQTQTRLASAIAALPASGVADAMGYAVAGGKGLRGFFVLQSAALFGIQDAVNAAAAVEAIHSYSLVHDDLPAMDDDDLRRGQPTVHKKWDEATAVLVGDALQTLGFDLLADPACHPDPARRVALIGSMARAVGAGGMVLGQAQDIAAETAIHSLGLDEITALQANKTGALIEWSATAGAILADADPTPLRTYATALGLAFQIADDILDIEGDAAAMGKATRKDTAAGKATFVSLLGLEGAKTRARDLVTQAKDALTPYGGGAESLRLAADFTIARQS